MGRIRVDPVGYFFCSMESRNVLAELNKTPLEKILKSGYTEDVAPSEHS